jgi:hypothetical protein
MLGGLSTFAMTEYPRAFVLIEPLIPTPYVEVMIRVLRKAKSGGVRLQLIDVPSDPAFQFASSRLLPEPDTSHGWGDANDPSTGGVWVGVIE